MASLKKKKATKVVSKKSTTSNQFTWTPAMTVGNPKLDKQHQILLSQINKLIDQLSKGIEFDICRDTLHFFYKYVQTHLADEEIYMTSIKYSGLTEQKKQHENFRKFYKKLYEEFEATHAKKELKTKDFDKLIVNTKKFLGDWWINHILHSDKKYYEFARKKVKPASETPAKISKKLPKLESTKEKTFNMAAIKAEIESKLKGGEIDHKEAAYAEQRAPAAHAVEKAEEIESKPEIRKKLIQKFEGREYLFTGIPGFDELLDKGIPQGGAFIVAGGTGSGKTIFMLQLMHNMAMEGKKAVYMSFEESEDRLKQHMDDFDWGPEKLIKKGLIKLQRFSPFDITRSVDALLAKAKGELLIDIDPVILPKDFKPDFIFLDSLTAIAAAFTGKDENYRIYIEQLFRFFEQLGATVFLITETEQVPKIFSPTGVEEFLSDGVIVLYAIRRGNIRENAIEIIKLRGAKHQKKIVAMQIVGGQGIVVYPEQEVFGGLE